MAKKSSIILAITTILQGCSSRSTDLTCDISLPAPSAKRFQLKDAWVGIPQPFSFSCKSPFANGALLAVAPGCGCVEIKAWTENGLIRITGVYTSNYEGFSARRILISAEGKTLELSLECISRRAFKLNRASCNVGKVLPGRAWVAEFIITREKPEEPWPSVPHTELLVSVRDVNSKQRRWIVSGIAGLLGGPFSYHLNSLLLSDVRIIGDVFTPIAARPRLLLLKGEVGSSHLSGRIRTQVRLSRVFIDSPDIVTTVVGDSLEFKLRKPSRSAAFMNFQIDLFSEEGSHERLPGSLQVQ